MTKPFDKEVALKFLNSLNEEHHAKMIILLLGPLLYMSGSLYVVIAKINSAKNNIYLFDIDNYSGNVLKVYSCQETFEALPF